MLLLAAASSAMPGEPVSTPATPLARWTFTEPTGPYYTTDGDLPLLDTNTAQPSTTETTAGSRAVNLPLGQSLYIPAADVGRLNIGGRRINTVTVASWVNTTRTYDQFFVAGIWQEDGNNPARQYGVFGSLPGLGLRARSCLHVSRFGGASPGWDYSYDASGNPTPAAVTNTWQFYVGTYDGTHARSYMNGVFTEDTSVFSYATSQRNPYHYPDGLNKNPGHFTVGAISGPDPVTSARSFLRGRVADLRVWDIKLDGQQIADLYQAERAAYGV